jgi:hypothetical protein
LETDFNHLINLRLEGKELAGEFNWVLEQSHVGHYLLSSHFNVWLHLLNDVLQGRVNALEDPVHECELVKLSMLEHRVATSALLIHQVIRLTLYDLGLDRIEQGHLGLRLQVVSGALLLLDEMRLRLSQVLRAVEFHQPPLTLLNILLLRALDQLNLELLHVVDFIVLVPLPYEFIVLLLNVGTYEAHLHEGVDGALNQGEVHHLIVAVLGNLVEDSVSQLVYDLVEALVAEQVQGCRRQGHCVVVSQVVPVLYAEKPMIRDDASKWG